MRTILIAIALVLIGAFGLVTYLAPQDAGVADAGGIGAGIFSPTATKTPTRTPGPSPTPTPAAPAPSSNGAAIGPGLMVAECRSVHPHSVRAIFVWHPSKRGVQYLDLSIFNNGFAPGTFIGVGLGADAYGFVWDGLSQATPHFIRVNTLTPSGWVSSETLAFYTPVCDPFNSEPQPAADMVGLRDRLAAATSQWNFDSAVAITDLQTGETVDVNGYANRLPGCTLNLFALMRVAVDLQTGRYAEPLPGDLIGQTINRSDPITARRLMRDFIGNGDLFAGINEVNEYMTALGMTDTLMDHPPAFPHESLYGGLNNRTTARDTNKGLRALWDGRAMSPGWRDYMLQKMTLVKPGLNYLIPAGTGAGAISSHKNGFLYELGWADNDIGIVWFERGGQRYGYAISFFTQYVPGKYDDIPLGQEVSRLAWQWFVGRYGYPN